MYFKTSCRQSIYKRQDKFAHGRFGKYSKAYIWPEHKKTPLETMAIHVQQTVGRFISEQGGDSNY